MNFKNRLDAGLQLCLLLEKYKNQDVVVYALPRGGVPIAAEIATYLNAPLDLILAHKIGHPHYEEFAIGAISENNHLIVSNSAFQSISEIWLEEEKGRQKKEFKRKRQLYLKGRKEISPKDKIAIIVDDGIATGLTMQIGIMDLKERHPKKIVAVVPVAPKTTAETIGKLVDEFVAVIIPDDDQFLGAVGAYYERFDQVEDNEVIESLKPNK